MCVYIRGPTFWHIFLFLQSYHLNLTHQSLDLQLFYYSNYSLSCINGNPYFSILPFQVCIQSCGKVRRSNNNNHNHIKNNTKLIYLLTLFYRLEISLSKVSHWFTIWKFPVSTIVCWTMALIEVLPMVLFYPLFYNSNYPYVLLNLPSGISLHSESIRIQVSY